MHRIFVGGMPPSQSEDDVRMLIGKLCTVRSVYIPPPTATGVHRGFAIVEVEADTDSVNKCVKAFNLCFWKGAKLRVEQAKEYYVHRLDQESDARRMEDEKLQEKIRSSREFSIPIFHADALTIKGRHSSAASIQVLTKPFLKSSSDGSRNYPRDGLRSVKTVFEEGENGIDIIAHNESLIPKSTRAKDDKGKEKKEVLSSSAKINLDDSNPSLSIQKPAGSLPVQPAGGGMRRGFGSLLSAPEPKPAALQTLQCQDIFKGDELDRQIAYDDIGYQSDDGEACIAAEDIEEEALNNERSRANDILARVLKLATENGPNTMQKPRKGDKEKAREEQNKDKDLKKDSSARSEPAKSDSKDVSLSERGKGTEAEQGLEHTAIDHANDKDGSEHHVVPSGSANLNVLKDIFHRDGGMWWGDDGTLDHAVAKGSVADNALFLEAEKLGIDIRDVDKPVSDGADEQTEGGGMMFGFFDDPVEENEGTAVVFGEQSVGTALAQPAGDSRAKDEGTDKRSQHDQLDKHDRNNSTDKQNGGVASMALTYAVPATFVSIIKSAKMFCRQIPVASIRAEWKKSRTGMLTSFKKKRSQARKRKSAREVSHTSMHTSRSHSDGRGNKRQKRQ